MTIIEGVALVFLYTGFYTFVAPSGTRLVARATLSLLDRLGRLTGRP